MSGKKEYSIVAPCGLNCSLCMAFLREKNKCPGCRFLRPEIPVHIESCRIRNCDNMLSGKLKYCYGCKDFPCVNLRRLDKRYRTKYNISVIDNLKNIKTDGIQKFLVDEKSRWACSVCGSTINMHKKCCSACGKAV